MPSCGSAAGVNVQRVSASGGEGIMRNCRYANFDPTRASFNDGSIRVRLEYAVISGEQNMSRSTIGLILGLCFCPVLSLSAQAQSAVTEQEGAIHC